MRLVRHIAPGDSPKRLSLRTMVRTQFLVHRSETHPDKIEAAKANAVRALANYMLFESGTKDPKIKQAMKDQVDKVKKDNAQRQ
jgi:hypothetical protein